MAVRARHATTTRDETAPLTAGCAIIVARLIADTDTIDLERALGRRHVRPIVGTVNSVRPQNVSA
jgi:hypothetical protein